MRVFILEDDQVRHIGFMGALIGHEVTLCDSVLKAKEAFKPPYDVILLDHDLGGQQMVDSTEDNTGYQFCVFLTEHNNWSLDISIAVVHSYNPEGAMKMCAMLKDDGYKVIRTPYGPKLLQWLQKGAPS